MRIFKGKKNLKNCLSVGSLSPNSRLPSAAGGSSPRLQCCHSILVLQLCSVRF